MTPHPLWHSLRSLLFAPQCPFCQRTAAHVFCRDCTAQILSQQRRNLRQQPSDFPFPCFIWGHYEGQLRRAIAKMKFEPHPEIGEWLGEQLAEAWLATPHCCGQKNLQVTAIPLHPSKQEQRGYNQAAKIAQGFCRITRFPFRPQALRRQKNTQPLFTLSPAERQQELHQALVPGSQFNDRQPWLIVDDILTTGATALAAQQVIQQQGGTLWGLAAITTPRFG